MALVLFALAAHGCVMTTSKGAGGHAITDNLLGAALDKVETSAEHPAARGTFVPTNNELRYVKGDPGWKQHERNYFSLAAGFDMKNAVKQKTAEDCWAACSLMLLKHEKIRFTPEQVDKLVSELTSASKAKDELGVYSKLLNSFKPATYNRPVTSSMLCNSIVNNHPIIVGFQPQGGNLGHICLVVGFTYSYIKPTSSDQLLGRKVNIAYDKVYYIDPADATMHEISGAEFKRTADFAISYATNVSVGGLISIRKK